MLALPPLLRRRSSRAIPALVLGALAIALALTAPLIASARPATRSRSHCTVRRSSAHRARCAKPVAAKPVAKRPARRRLAESLPSGSPGIAPAAKTRVTPPSRTREGSGKHVTESEEEEPVEAASGNLPADSGETVSDTIDPRFLTDVPFGKRSFWLQPWRAYLDTVPASRLQEALGINFPADPAVAEPTAHLLHDSGFALARLAINWDAISYANPTEFKATNMASITTRLSALHKYGLRPLIVLNANSGDPGPLLHLKLETVSAVAAGAQSVTLTPASAALVIPGKTGFNSLTFGGSPDVLITAVSPHHVATLSRPLLHPLPAGSHGASTLRYAPFQAPLLAGGQPNPSFHETLAGWLSYVRAVCNAASAIVGPGGYDIEVWNELTFGSQFLNSEHYYSQSSEGTGEAEAESQAETESQAEAEDPAESEGEAESEAEAEAEGQAEEDAPVRRSAANPGRAKVRLVSKQIRRALLEETVALIRNPANGFSPAVGITDGFASQTPFPSGADAPLGLTALSKHPYTGAKSFPAAFREARVRPINALGARDTSTKKSYVPLFVPTFQSLFPEYWLTATATETLTRDIAPFTTEVYGFPHGREVGPVGGSPVQKWITEFNVGSHRGAVVGPDEVTPQTGRSAQLTVADRAHFQAKVALRSLVSNVNKGVSREYFFKAAPGGLSLIGPDFFSAAESNPQAYPGDQLGGETMGALHDMLSAVAGPGQGSQARQLELRSITQQGNHAQFTGDGTSAHPSLYDRDVLAVLPFQSSPTRFVIPVYVMTRDLLTLYEPQAPQTDVQRFDLPNESFKITLGNLPQAGPAPSVSAYDPLLKQATPARLVSREGTTAVFELAATDYPRLLTIQYPGA
ncbi:MAG: hypothetical protein ACYDHN_01045 [Solirubrobacteraceae bacterium]